MSHERRIDRLNPALILALLDQSDSMAETISDSVVPKSLAVAEQINRLIYELILRCVKTPREPPRDYIYVGVLGYSTGPSGAPVVVPCLDIPGADEFGVAPVSALAMHPRRVDRKPSGDSGAHVNSPVWVEPISRGGTPMCAALNQTGRIIAAWIKQHPDAFPPIVINLTDGESTDGRPIVWANRLRSVGTSDGEVLVFNINLSSTPAQPILFPSDLAYSPLADSEYATELFDMSSCLPAGMVSSGIAQGLNIKDGARGFAFNADINTLAHFLNVGTRVGRVGP